MVHISWIWPQIRETQEAVLSNVQQNNKFPLSVGNGVVIRLQAYGKGESLTGADRSDERNATSIGDESDKNDVLSPTSPTGEYSMRGGVNGAVSTVEVVP